MKTKYLLLPVLTVLGLASTASHAGPLGTADSFAVLGGSTVTSTGPTVLNGDLGVNPGTAITGFPPGTVNGTIHSADATARQAQTDAATAFSILAGETSTNSLTGQDLGGLTLNAGVYNYATSAALTGTLTLDAQGDPNAIFVFQIGSTLTTASSSAIDLLFGAQADNVYWEVGTSATLGTDTAMVGTILADTSITLETGASLDGRALALNGAVTLDDNLINVPAAAPEPASLALLALCPIAFGIRRWVQTR